RLCAMISTIFPYTTLFRSIIYMLDSIINGKPEFREGMTVQYATIEGDGSYVGSKAGAVDIDGNDFLSALSGHTFVGNNEFNGHLDRKSTRLNSSHVKISYA